VDSPRGRYSSTSGERAGRTKGYGNGRADENRRDGGFQDRNARFGRRDQRSANPQTIQRRTVHYQVVTMDDEEWGDTLENRLNSLGHDGWRLVAIDEGRQYVFVQMD
jgi:hypothetical protein